MLSTDVGTQTVGSRHSDSESASDVRASRLASREAGNALGLQRDNYMAVRKVTPPAASVPEVPVFVIFSSCFSS